MLSPIEISKLFIFGQPLNTISLVDLTCVYNYLVYNILGREHLDLHDPSIIVFISISATHQNLTFLPKLTTQGDQASQMHHFLILICMVSI